jgi:glyoxylate reductase
MMSTAPDPARRRIVVTGRIPVAGLEILRRIDGADVWSWDHDEVIPTDVRDEQLATADAAVTLLTDKVDAAFLDAGPRLQIVANVAVGYNNIDVVACAAREVVVTNTPGVLTDATADLAMGLVLMTTRRLGEGERLIRSGTAWQWGMFMMLGTGLQGRRLGIIGMGAIGEALATRAKAFGMEIVYSNRRAADADVEARLGARRVAIDELLATSDVVSLNCPYSEATHHLIDAAALAKMQRHAHLINTARGPIVDEAALVDALTAGTIAGAGLDVFEHEPVVHPGLVTLDNVVLVPHLGSATVETRSAMATTAADNVDAVLGGGAPLNPVTL